MQAKTKYVAIAVGISLSMALLSTCQGPKEAPKDNSRLNLSCA